MFNTTTPAEIRASFAAMAPGDIPAWFKFKFRDRPPLPDPKSLSAEHQRQWDGLGNWLSLDEVDPDVRDFSLRYDAACHARDQHDRELAEATYFAWRWHFADQMLKLHNANQAGANPSHPAAVDLADIPIYEIWRGNAFDRFCFTESKAEDCFSRPLDKENPGASLCIYAFDTIADATDFAYALEEASNKHPVIIHEIRPGLTCALLQLDRGRHRLRFVDLRS